MAQPSAIWVCQKKKSKNIFIRKKIVFPQQRNLMHFVSNCSDCNRIAPTSTTLIAKNRNLQHSRITQSLLLYPETKTFSSNLSVVFCLSSELWVTFFCIIHFSILSYLLFLIFWEVLLAFTTLFSLFAFLFFRKILVSFTRLFKIFSLFFLSYRADACLVVFIYKNKNWEKKLWISWCFRAFL